MELSSQLLTGDKAHSSVQNLPKINSPKGFEEQQDVCYQRGIGQSFFRFILLERGGLCFLLAFAQIPEFDFAVIIRRSLKLIIPLLNVNFGSHPPCLKV